jgi:hypothetical protein
VSRTHAGGRNRRRQFVSFVTLRVFEKNYRLQDIQLSKSSLSYRVVPMLQAQRFGCRGGEYRARTGDLLVANQALSQLS